MNEHIIRVLGGFTCLAGLLACSPAPPEPPPDQTPAWNVVFEGNELDRAVLSVWGASPSEVFVVGGPLGNEGFETLALAYDGTAWKDLRPGGSESFWWVAGTAADDVWMVGENGRIAHYDGQKFTAHESGTTATLWGVMPFSANDVWVVGGTPNGGTDAPNDIILRYDGTTWSPQSLPGDALGVALYKVSGTSSDDLYVVGEQGTIWHWSAGSWTLEPVPSNASGGTLFTVRVCGSDQVYAVGGTDVLMRDGSGQWLKQDVSLSNAVFGVSCAAPDEVVLAGAGGLKQRLVDGQWIDEFTKAPYADLHATWAADNGELWVAGGGFMDANPKPFVAREGVVARYGPGAISDDIAP